MLDAILMNVYVCSCSMYVVFSVNVISFCVLVHGDVNSEVEYVYLF